LLRISVVVLCPTEREQQSELERTTTMAQPPHASRSASQQRVGRSGTRAAEATWLDVDLSARGTPDEHRDHASRRELLRRIRVEYAEMPGLRLTAAQAQRLFGLREDICARVLDALVHGGVLRRDENGAFALTAALGGP
jgi:hypothetical protein